ncbi:acetyl-coenzyme A synthetase N-terminal domain-containing protein, partial [Streptomyces nodosus]
MTSANTVPLWQPDADRIARARITRFQAWAAQHHGAPAEGGYAALHRWSVDELDTFWKAVTEFFEVRFSTPFTQVLGDRSMPGAAWFPGARLNYAEHALRAAATRADQPALLAVDETQEPRPVTWSALRRQVGSLAAELRALGVRPGDRVSGYLPNIPEA